MIRTDSIWSQGKLSTISLCTTNKNCSEIPRNATMRLLHWIPSWSTLKYSWQLPWMTIREIQWRRRRRRRARIPWRKRIEITIGAIKLKHFKLIRLVISIYNIIPLRPSLGFFVSFIFLDLFPEPEPEPWPHRSLRPFNINARLWQPYAKQSRWGPNGWNTFFFRGIFGCPWLHFPFKWNPFCTPVVKYTRRATHRRVSWNNSIEEEIISLKNRSFLLMSNSTSMHKIHSKYLEDMQII